MYKDQTWASWNCILGWPVQGIFPPAANGTDINMVARSPDASVLASADDFGMVKLFRFPCPVNEAAFKQYNGHSSHVTNVAFSSSQGQQYLVSTGGEDKCIFQWKYNLDKTGFGESQIMKGTKSMMPNSEIGNDYGDEDDYGGEHD